MSTFLPAFAATMKLEGGYANNPHDHGGETYKGISRNNWRGWPGWPDIDRMKQIPPNPPSVKGGINPNFPACLDRNADLQGKVRDFYFRNFWTPSLEAIKDQELANWLFDKGVNMGIRQAVKLLQRALYVDADGVIGPQTMNKLNAADPADLLGRCRDEAKRFYTKLALEDPTQSRFLHGWLARA